MSDIPAFPSRRIAFVSSSAMACALALRWILDGSLLAFFFEPALELLILAFFVVSFVIDFVIAAKRLRVHRLHALRAVAIYLVTTLIVASFPFTEIWVNVNYRLHQAIRQKVVAMIEAGELTADASGRIDLPPAYRACSKSGGVNVEEREGARRILFFTSRGILDNFSGFIYCSNGRQPNRTSFGGDFWQFEHYGERWFWGVSY